jgi:hypothetical protein
MTAAPAMRRIQDINPKIARAHIENLVRFFFCRSVAVDDYIALVRTIWDEVESDPAAH